jgi:hypothetical protein
MAANSLLEMSRSLRLYVPQLPITLAEQFIRDRYRRILERRNWSATRRESQFILSALKNGGSVTIVRDSTTVLGSGTAFASTDVGRQFKVGQGSPIYTITAVASATSLTVNMPIGVASGAGKSYWIMDAFVTPPSDFLEFVVVANPVQGWRLRHNVTAGELMAMDPQRTFTGQPYLLADRIYDVATTADANDYRPQYECWPYTTSDVVLYYQYITRVADLVNPTDQPIYPIRSDAIVAGALADVARWPGTVDQPNPYFQRPEYWKAYEGEYEDKMIEIERRDEDLYLSQLEMYPYTSYGLVPFSARWLQSHAV